MKIPEKAPDWFPILEGTFHTLFKDKSSERIGKLNEFVSAIDQKDEYVYWDRFRYFTMPEEMLPKSVWAFLKLSRQSKIIKTKLINGNSKYFGYWIPDSVLKNLSFIDTHASGEMLIGEPTVHRSEQKKYLVNSLMEEAIASSQLEGAATTRKIAKEMLRSGRKPKSHSEQMIYNNYQTITKIKALTKHSLSERLILNLHQSMTDDTLEDPTACGRFRTKKDGPICVRDQENQILYEPPSADRISSMMQLLYQYANETSDKKFTHPVIKAINLHFYLSYIHPFMDGNGRTARALFYWYMLKHEYWMFEYLTISRIFLKAPAQYARAFLYTEMDDLDLTYFISFNLRTIKTAISELVNYIKRKQKETKEISYYLKKFPQLNDRQRGLIKHALAHPDSRYTISSHQTIHDITYEAARRDLLSLANNHYLIKTKEGKKFYFMPSEKLHKKIKHR